MFIVPLRVKDLLCRITEEQIFLEMMSVLDQNQPIMDSGLRLCQ